MRPILLLAAALTLPAHAAAQTFGLHVGAARTSVAISEEEEDVDAKTGLVGGVSFDLPISDIAGFRLGAVYVQKGVSFTEDYDLEGSVSLNYIELPAMLRFGSSVYGLVGAALGIKSGCSASFKFQGQEASFDCSDPEADLGEFKTIDFGISAGIGFSARASDSISLTLEVLHNRGLSNVSDEVDGKNRAFTAMAGIAIDLGG